ncbi:RNA-binding protein 48-like [Polymixia lowei]
MDKEPMPSDIAYTSERTTSTDDQSSGNNNTGESSSTSHYLGFPLLPLPPQEDCLYRHNTVYRMPFQANLDRTIPTEDKMGSLHNAIIDTIPQTTQSSRSNQTFCKGDGDVERRLAPKQVSVVRFVPRTTQLENRKRKMEQPKVQLFGVMGNNEPLIGPKLPEPPKLDMEDQSLNTTVNLIRSTMKQVASVPDKPVEKKIKPRRRI